MAVRALPVPWLHTLPPVAAVPREEAGVCFSLDRHGDLFVEGALSLGSLKLSRWERGSGASPGRTLGSSSFGGTAEVGAHLVLQQQTHQCETWEETSQKWLHCLADTALSAPGCDKRRRGKATGLQRAAAAATPRKLHRYRRHAAPRGPASASINHGEEGLSLLLLLLSLLQHCWGKGGDEDCGPWAHLGMTPPAVAAASCPAGPELPVLGQHQGKLLSLLSL